MRMLSRRDLGKAALASIPLSTALAKPDSRVNGVMIGAQSYSFRDRPLDAAIKALVEVGLSEVELWQGHVEPQPKSKGKEAQEELRKFRLETPLSYFKDIRKKFDVAGINLYAYNLSFRNDFTDAEFTRGFEIVKALGVKYITASSTLETARRMKPFVEKAKIAVAMHNHSNLTDPNEFATPKSFETALAMSPWYRINLDIGHFWAAGFDPVEYIDKHHDKIVTLHIKDRVNDKGQGKGANMPFGQADTPIKQVLQLLKKKKYNIPANIEYEYKGEDAVAEVRKCFEYCKQALA